MLKQLATKGTIKAYHVLTQCRLLTTKYSGIMMLSKGTIISAMMAVRMNSRPLNCSFASA
ncbi:hypothetical protein LJK87_45535 [Paenibacillus sp. P25]|nr:hypothetical protein LJK87_45535 [Paenibacillus sp. P25]